MTPQLLQSPQRRDRSLSPRRCPFRFSARVFEQRQTRFSTSDSVRRARPRLLEDPRVLDRLGGLRVVHRGRRTRANQSQARRARSS